MVHHERFTRRELVGVAAGLSIASFGTGSAAAKEPTRKRVLRLAHLTDLHVQPELRAPDGMAACLRHAQSQADKPSLILFGGDCVMDAFGQTRDRVKAQWDVWHRVLKSECSLPWEACIGNHDVWGWTKDSGRADANDRNYGKTWAVDELKLGKRYRAFEKAGWKFIVLDSTHPGARPGSYTAKLDTEQFDWLAGEVRSTPKQTPILVLSHIPILAACAYLDGNNEKTGDWQVPGAWMHIDARKLTRLFHEQGNVRLCLSGHIHLTDEVNYLGTKYCCNGAVCGGWWKGKYQQVAEGYALIDLYDDGSSNCEYVSYGWNAAATAK
jgi:Icc protein